MQSGLKRGYLGFQAGNVAGHDFRFLTFGLELLIARFEFPAFGLQLLIAYFEFPAFGLHLRAVRDDAPLIAFSFHPL